MRHQHLFSVLFTLTLAGGGAVACSSSSNGGSPTTDSGSDTSGGGDTATDSGGVDTRTPHDTGSETSSGDTGTDTGGGTCDPVLKTGCTAPNTKCTAVDDGTGSGGVMPGCVAPGTAAVDAPCTRDSETSAGVGHDTCAEGYCSGFGSLSDPPVRHCRKFCGADTDCPSTDKCMGLIVDPGGTPLYGICIPTCTLFGTDCGTGMTCGEIAPDMDGSTVVLSCRQTGSAAVGGACVTTGTPAGPAPYDCPDNSLCFDPTPSGTNFVCNALCDGTHTCATGTCKTSGTGLPGGAGVCG